MFADPPKTPHAIPSTLRCSAQSSGKGRACITRVGVTSTGCWSTSALGAGTALVCLTAGLEEGAALAREPEAARGDLAAADFAGDLEEEEEGHSVL